MIVLTNQQNFSVVPKKAFVFQGSGLLWGLLACGTLLGAAAEPAVSNRDIDDHADVCTQRTTVMADNGSPVDRHERSAGKMRPQRDPNIALQEEYELARRRGTANALEQFIERHPDTPLAERARRELNKKAR
jgi:hypothetical protein